MSLSAKGMLEVTVAKNDHDRRCPWRKPALEVHIHSGGLDDLGWEDGDTIAGLVIVADDTVPRRRLRVLCEGDLKDAGKAETETVSVDAVAEDRELVPVGAPSEGFETLAKLGRELRELERA